MDRQRFDEWTRTLGGTAARRSLLKAAAGGALALVTARGAGAQLEAEACGRKHDHCKKNKDCCKGLRCDKNNKCKYKGGCGNQGDFCKKNKDCCNDLECKNRKCKRKN